jgi:L-lactate dehydrogenase
MRTNNSKIVVVGAGKVGSTTAYTLMMSHLASEIVLIDVNKDRARGEALDISHGIAYLWQTTVREGDFEDCADADIIIITAGIGRQPGQTRLDLARTNVGVVRTIMEGVMKYAVNPLLFIISNPVDVLTYMVQKETGLPASRVIGSGTMLDTGRFRYLLSDHCKVDVRNVHAYIVGEHGDSELPLWSHASLASKPFEEFCETCGHPCGGVNRQKMFEATRDAGIEIIKKKGATFYGVSLAAARVVSAVMGDENAVLTLSSVLNGQYGLSDVAISLPCIVNSSGIDRFLDLHISDEEQKLLEASAEKLKIVFKEVL